MSSPLKRPGDLARLATQLDTRPIDYAAVSNGIDADMRSFEARQRSFKEQRRQEKLDKIRDYRVGMLKADQLSSLKIDSNSGYSSVDNYFRQAGNALADEASNLMTLYGNNEITSDEFANKYSNIQSQVEQLKPFAAGIQTMMQNYQSDLANGTLSAANKGMYEDFYQAVSEDKGNLFLDENGILTYQGKTDGPDGSEEFSIPINQLQKIPQPIKKVDSFESLTKDTAKILSTPVERFDPVTGRTTMESPTPNLNNQEYNTGIRTAFDEFLKQQGNNGLRSLAVDHLGMDIDEMEGKINSGAFVPRDEDFSQEEIANGFGDMIGERFSSQLEFEMEKQFIKTGMQQSQYTQLQNKMQAELDLKRRQLDIQAQNAARQQAKAASGTAQERMMASNQRFFQSNVKALGENFDPTKEESIAILNQDTNANVNFEMRDGKLYAVGRNSKTNEEQAEPINNMYDFYLYYGAGHGLTPAMLNDMGLDKQKLRTIPLNYNKTPKNNTAKNSGSGAWWNFASRFNLGN